MHVKKFGFGNKFIKWIQILMKNPELCVISSGKIRPHFKLERATRQGETFERALEFWK